MKDTNKYRPWVYEGISEAEYFKLRYLEAETENMKLRELADDAYTFVKHRKDNWPNELTTWEWDWLGKYHALQKTPSASKGESGT